MTVWNISTQQPQKHVARRKVYITAETVCYYLNLYNKFQLELDFVLARDVQRGQMCRGDADNVPRIESCRIDRGRNKCIVSGGSRRCVTLHIVTVS